MMKTLDWVETSGIIFTSDICLSNEPASGFPRLSVMSIATHSKIFNAIMQCISVDQAVEYGPLL